MKMKVTIKIPKLIEDEDEENEEHYIEMELIRDDEVYEVI